MQQNYVMRLNDGKTVTVFNTTDFELLIDEYLGYDACEYFQELMSEWDEDIESAEQEREELKERIDELLKQQ